MKRKTRVYLIGLVSLLLVTYTWATWQFFTKPVPGGNDILAFFWLMSTVVLMLRNRSVMSAMTLALVCATKQPAWFFVPFYCPS